ncbi:MAG: cytochrome c-type biogenesis protein CcmH [Asticcacaulis sp.]
MSPSRKTLKATRGLVVVALAVFLMGAASDPSEQLADPAQEARARTLFKDIRCVVCQNESIDDSNAEMAVDMRRLVREQIVAGKSDADIQLYLLDRYGDFVLFTPRLTLINALLWGGPFLLLVTGLAVFWRTFVRRPKASARTEPILSPQEPAFLTAEEQARLEALLSRKD